MRKLFSFFVIMLAIVFLVGCGAGNDKSGLVPYHDGSASVVGESNYSVPIAVATDGDLSAKVFVQKVAKKVRTQYIGDEGYNEGPVNNSTDFKIVVDNSGDRDSGWAMITISGYLLENARVNVGFNTSDVAIITSDGKGSLFIYIENVPMGTTSYMFSIYNGELDLELDAGDLNLWIQSDVEYLFPKPQGPMMVLPAGIGYSADMEMLNLVLLIDYDNDVRVGPSYVNIGNITGVTFNLCKQDENSPCYDYVPMKADWYLNGNDLVASVQNIKKGSVGFLVVEVEGGEYYFTPNEINIADNLMWLPYTSNPTPHALFAVAYEAF